MEACLL